MCWACHSDLCRCQLSKTQLRAQLNKALLGPGSRLQVSRSLRLGACHGATQLRARIGLSSAEAHGDAAESEPGPEPRAGGDTGSTAVTPAPAAAAVTGPGIRLEVRVRPGRLAMLSPASLPVRVSGSGCPGRAGLGRRATPGRRSESLAGCRQGQGHGPTMSHWIG